MLDVVGLGPTITLGASSVPEPASSRTSSVSPHAVIAWCRVADVSFHRVLCFSAIKIQDQDPYTSAPKIKKAGLDPSLGLGDGLGSGEL